MPRCQQLKGDGESCGQSVPEGDSLCLWHDPARAEEAKRIRKAGGKKGGLRKGNLRTIAPTDALAPPETAFEAKQWTAWTAHAVATGVISPQVGQQVSSALRVFLTALEKADLATEIEDLRTQVEALKNGK